MLLDRFIIGDAEGTTVWLEGVMTASIRRLLWAVSIGILCLHCAADAIQSQPVAGAPTTSTTRILGTVTAVDGSTVTVKSDAGVDQKVSVHDGTRMLQTAPGQTTLAGATPIHVQDLQVGDRVSARGTMSDDGASLNAASLIAMKEADLQKKQDADREDWKKRGISGVVKLVDTATGTVTVTAGVGAAAKTLTVHAAKTTVIRRYAVNSAKLADAKPATLDQVKPGDELQARGTRSADNSELAAEEIVAGSFRNLAGKITAVDKSAGTISLTDLATKRPYVIRCTADSQMRKLPPAMAQMLAARLKGEGGRPAGSDARVSAAANEASKNRTGLSSGNASSADGRTHGPTGALSGEHASADAVGPPQRGSDPQQMLGHAPAIQLSELQTGDVVMVVATEGIASGTGMPPGSSTAITLIAGVEPMLQASTSGSQNLLSSSWSLGSGTPGGEASQ